MILAGLLGGAAKGIGRDLGMGFGVTERDQDYFDRTRETLRRQYGDDRAALYERQTAAQRAAAPKGRVENPRRSEKGILSTIIGDLKLGLPNQGRSTRATSSGSTSGSDMSSSLRPRTRPMMGVPQSADLIDFPLMNMQRGMSGLPNMSMPANAAYLPPLSSQLMQEPPKGITGAGEQIPVTSGLIPRIPTFEEFLDATGLEDTEENREVYIETYVRSMGG